MKVAVYYDTGKGYYENRKTEVLPEPLINGTGFQYRIEIPENCIGIRIEPLIESGKVVLIHSITAAGEELAACSEEGEQIGSSFCLLAEEQYFAVPLAKKYSSVQITASFADLEPELAKLIGHRLFIDRNSSRLPSKDIEKIYTDIQNLYTENKRFTQELQELKSENERMSAQLVRTRAEKLNLQYEYFNTVDKYKRLETGFLAITNSKFWKLSYPLRKVLNTIKIWWTKIRKPEPSAETARDNTDAYMAAEKADELFINADRIGIVATKHTMYIAGLLRKALEKYDIECCILSEEPDSYLEIPYIFIAPLFIKKFPKLYIVYQMEQTVNSRWMTEHYISVLENAYAVLDYSIVNIKFFDQYPEIYKKIYYMPLDVNRELIAEHPARENKKHDVLFYGDTNCPRRTALLNELRKRFDVSIRNNLFGEELYSSICDCKVMVNIHYAENSLLETTRLYETLSLGNCVIVSEKSRDMDEDGRLDGIVDFVDIGDIQALVERISYWISHDEEREKRISETNEFFMHGSSALEFFFGRFLLANDRTDFDTFYSWENAYIRFRDNRVCLNLPESAERRTEFRKDNVYGFEFFPGLKYKLAWIGCAMSYKFIFRKALEQGFEQLLICEDDVFFPPEFSTRFEAVMKYLDNSSDWDIYSGIMSDIGDVEIRKVIEKGGEQFVYLDRLISMVFNIYNKSVFGLLSSWDETNRDIITNTIDRYLENTELNIITNYPFLVGHKENLDSTIWQSSNTVYTDMIARSSKKLKELISARN